jgi:pyruvate/2-oxoacid:ferredoxin oxidoreductase beta subunit
MHECMREGERMKAIILAIAIAMGLGATFVATTSFSQSQDGKRSGG